MKKLLILLVLSIVIINTFGQVAPQRINETLKSNYKFTQDTFFTTKTLYANYTWSAQAVWDSVNNTDAVITVKVSNDGINYLNYYEDLSNVINTPKGSCGWTDDILSFNYVQFIIYRNSVTSGKISIYLSANKRQ